MTRAISPGDGPVAVTGAAGFIGSHIVRKLVRRGYQVRACVRAPDNHHAVAHLRMIGREGPGALEFRAGDMMQSGAYDEAFRDCIGVFHAAAEMGNLEGSSPQKVYDGGLEATQRVVNSIRLAGTVRRLVYTSSFAAVAHPADEGHAFTEASWADMNAEWRPPEFGWTKANVRHSREVAYAMGKVDTERFVYAAAERAGFAAFGICPIHVIGPLLSASHQRPWTWQTRIGDMLEGYGHGRMLWNIVDVRDVAEAQILVAESEQVRSGERYILGAADESGMLTQPEIQAVLRRFYPGCGIAGDYREGPARRSPIATVEKAISQLALRPRSAEAAIRDNAESLLMWGLVRLRPGEDNWQRDGRELGVASRFKPHAYPAMDPDAARPQSQPA